MNDPAYLRLEILDLLLAAALIVGVAAVGLAYRLGLGRRLLIAALRASLQLLLVGFVLEWVFSLKNAWAVLAILAWMVAMATWTARGRLSRRIPGLTAVLGVAILGSSMAVTFYGVLVVLRTPTWYEPQYIIPVAGMLLGNTLNGITLSVDRLLGGFVEQRDRVEMLLAHGACRGEALREIRQEAVRSALIPLLNALLIAGLVSLPGMMTGQILAGASPLDAVRYQLVIFFLIGGATAGGVVLNVLLAPRLLFDARDRPLYERITETR